MRLQRRLCTKQNQMYANDCSRAWFLLVSSTLPWSWSTAAGWEPQFQQDSGHDFLLLVRSTHHWFVLLHHRSCCWLLVLLSVRALRFHRSLPSCFFVLSFAVTSVPASFGAFQRANSTRPIISYTLIQTGPAAQSEFSRAGLSGHHAPSRTISLAISPQLCDSSIP